MSALTKLRMMLLPAATDTPVGSVMVMVVPVLLPVAVPMFLTKAMVAAASECSRATNPSASAVVTSASLPLPFIASSVLADERIVATAARGEGGLMAALPPFFGCGGARITLVRRSCQGTQRIREPPPGLLLCHLRCVAKIRRRQPHQEEPCREKLRGARLASTPRGVLASFTVVNLGMFYNAAGSGSGQGARASPMLVGLGVVHPGGGRRD